MNRVTLACAALLVAIPAAAEVPVTAEALAAQPEIPAEFDAMAYPQRIEWLQRQLALATDPVRRYQLVSERAFQQMLMEGWAHAATEISPAHAGTIADWLRRRLAHVAAGRSTVVVNHDDLVAVLRTAD